MTALPKTPPLSRRRGLLLGGAGAVLGLGAIAVTETIGRARATVGFGLVHPALPKLTVAEFRQARAAVLRDRPFAASSPFNTRIPASSAIDQRSGAMISSMARRGVAYADLVEYGIPIYEVSAATPRESVSCTMSPAWGRCPFADAAVPVPADARIQAGTDRVLVTVDRSSDRSYELWGAERSGDRLDARWGAINRLSGSGWGGAATGSGASRLGGVIRVDEIRAGLIPHAVVVATDNVCASIFRDPATKTDGVATTADCVPEGTRVQLDPGIDVTVLPQITPAEMTIARALQVYGAFVIDRSGTSLSMAFELAPDAAGRYPGAVYTANGLLHDYFAMSHIPWNRLRVIRA